MTTVCFVITAIIILRWCDESHSAVETEPVKNEIWKWLFMYVQFANAE